MSAGLEVELAGERVRLLAERALAWPRAATLFVADPHWGKAAAFRAGGVPVPGGTTAADLERLDRAIDRSAAQRLIVLGDLLHARAGRQPGTLDVIAAWRARHAALEIVVVRGNHDRRAGDLPEAFGLRCIDEPAPLAPFVLRHVPHPDAAGHVLAGHLHPGVTLVGRARERARLPCFVLGSHVTILPAFGRFTGTAEPVLEGGQRVFVVTGDEVIPVARRTRSGAQTDIDGGVGRG